MAKELNALSADDRAIARFRYPARGALAVGIVLLSALAAYCLFRTDPWGEQTGDSPASFELDLKQQVAIDARLIGYRQSATIELTLEQPKAIAIGPQDVTYVAGDQAVHVFAADGDRLNVIDLEGEPTCLAVGGAEHHDPGRIYVGTASDIWVFDTNHQPIASWPLPAEAAVLTSIAVAENDVFVADAGTRVVWRFNANGDVVGKIGAPDPARGFAGFVVPSPTFDVAVGVEGLVYIVNPGKLQIAAFTFDGDFGNAWGRPSSSLEGFFGCCNPVHIAQLPDGRFITSEKGIPRIKVYRPQGVFQSVVAGPQQLGVSEQAVGDPRLSADERVFDIAVDSRGRILVLDSKHKIVRIFLAIDESNS